MADDRYNCGKKAGPEQRREQRDKRCPGELMRCLGGGLKKEVSSQICRCVSHGSERHDQQQGDDHG